MWCGYEMLCIFCADTKAVLGPTHFLRMSSNNSTCASGIICTHETAVNVLLVRLTPLNSAVFRGWPECAISPLWRVQSPEWEGAATRPVTFSVENHSPSAFSADAHKTYGIYYSFLYMVYVQKTKHENHQHRCRLCSGG